MINTDKKQNFFKLKCTKCKKEYAEESFDPTIEAECPFCGTWNYTEKKSTRPSKKAKRK